MSVTRVTVTLDVIGELPGGGTVILGDATDPGAGRYYASRDEINATQRIVNVDDLDRLCELAQIPCNEADFHGSDTSELQAFVSRVRALIGDDDE